MKATSFTVQLSNAVNATIERGTGTGTIADDDHGGPAIPFASIGHVNVVEGNSGLNLASFTLRLSIASASLTRVRFKTQDGTATSVSDYLPVSGEITFQPGETVKSFTVAILGDVLFEPDETFNIVITGADNATFSATPATCTTSTTTPAGTASPPLRTPLVACKGSFGTSNAVFHVDVTPANRTWLVVVAGDVSHQFAA